MANPLTSSANHSAEPHNLRPFSGRLLCAHHSAVKRDAKSRELCLFQSRIQLAPASLHCANLNLVAFEVPLQQIEFQAHNENGAFDETMVLIFMRRFHCKSHELTEASSAC
jgi:hypothetical protein